MIQTTQFHFSLPVFTWAELLFLFFVPRAAPQSAVQPEPSFASHENWDPSIAAMVGALFCAFLFMGFFSIYLRHCSDAHTAAAAGGTGEWQYSSSQGIDRKILDSFPILVYSTIKDLKIGKGALECAVCLSEFKDDEILRLLPKCNHVFHPGCIDDWLSSHVTCPVCRENLSPEPEVAITIPTTQLNANESSNNPRDEHGHNTEQVQPQNLQGQSSMNSGEDDTVAVDEAPLKLKKSNSTGHCEFECCGRLNSTGHCEFECGGNKRDRYTLRLPEDVRKYILLNHGSIRRSASYHPSSRKCFKRDVERSVVSVSNTA